MELSRASGDRFEVVVGSGRDMKQSFGGIDGIPGPPTDMVMPAMLQSILIYLSTVLIAVLAVWAVIQIIRRRDLFPATLLLGGLLVYFSVEPFYDALGFVYHPERGQIGAFNALGRNYPLHLMLLYVVYYAGLGMYFDKKFADGVSARWVWGAFFVWIPAQILFETPLLMRGLWSYYGDPPFRVGFYPLWLAPATAGSAILAFSLVHYLKKKLLRAWIPVLSVVLASALAAGCLGICWPIFLALNVDRRTWPSGAVLTIPASILTITLSAGSVWLALQILAWARQRTASTT